MAAPWRSLIGPAVALVALVALGGGGCGGGAGDDGGDASRSDADADADTASTVCNELRAFNDDVVDAVNASVAGISSLAPQDRAPAIAAGLVEVRAIVTAWRLHVEDLALGPIDEATELRAQMVGGADAALAELLDEAAIQATNAGPISDREVQGAVGQWFNAVEKVVSVSEPQIHRFERRDFRQAFLDEPACRNVIQQFRND